MSTILDGAYKFWASKQSNLMPLGNMRLLEAELAAREAKSILVIGVDMTAVAFLAYAREAGAHIDVVVPRNNGLTKQIRRICEQMQLSPADVVEAEKSVQTWVVDIPDSLRGATYDFLMLYDYGSSSLNHRTALAKKIGPMLRVDATVCAYPCDGSDVSELVADWACWRERPEVQQHGHLVITRPEVVAAALPEPTTETPLTESPATQNDGENPQDAQEGVQEPRDGDDADETSAETAETPERQNDASVASVASAGDGVELGLFSEQMPVVVDVSDANEDVDRVKVESDEVDDSQGRSPDTE